MRSPQRTGDLARDGPSPESFTEKIYVGLLLGHVELHHLLVVIGQDLQQVVPVGVGLLFHVVGDGPVFPLFAHAFGRPVMRGHRDEVDDAVEVLLLSDRELSHDRQSVQTVVDHLHRAEEIRPDPVHLVDEADARDVVTVGLAPHGLGLGLHARHRVEHGDGAVQHAQAALHLDGEVDVAGGVDDVDPVVPFQWAVVAADVIVMPRSCSWIIQSITAAPSCTSPIL